MTGYGLTLISSRGEEGVVDVKCLVRQSEFKGIGDFDVSTVLSADKRAND